MSLFKKYRFEIIILFAAFVVRLAAVFLLHGHFGDEQEYLKTANDFLHLEFANQNDLLFIRAPGYPAFIALLWLCSWYKSVVLIKLAQVILSVVTCWYLYLMSRCITARYWTHLLTLTIAAFYPYHIHQVTQIESEILFTFLVVVGVYCTGCFTKNYDYKQLVYGVGLLALANMVRPNVMLAFPLLVIFIFLRLPLRHAVNAALMLAISIYVVAAPHTLVVNLQSNRWVFVSDGKGFNFWASHNDYAYAMYCTDSSPYQRREYASITWPDVTKNIPVYKDAEKAAPNDRSDVFYREGMTWVHNNWEKIPCLTENSLLAYWRPWVDKDFHDRTTFLISVLSSFVLIFGIVGWFRCKTDWVFGYIVMCFMLAGTMGALLSVPQLRYRIPMVDTLLIPFVGCAFIKRVKNESNT